MTRPQHYTLLTHSPHRDSQLIWRQLCKRKNVWRPRTLDEPWHRLTAAGHGWTSSNATTLGRVHVGRPEQQPFCADLWTSPQDPQRSSLLHQHGREPSKHLSMQPTEGSHQHRDPIFRILGGDSPPGSHHAESPWNCQSVRNSRGERDRPFAKTQSNV